MQNSPQFKQHDGVFYILERVKPGAKRGNQVKKGGPVGDGHGRPNSQEFMAEDVEFAEGDLIRLVIHPNCWWGQDLTRVDYLKIERVGE